MYYELLIRINVHVYSWFYFMSVYIRAKRNVVLIILNSYNMARLYEFSMIQERPRTNRPWSMGHPG
jgi:hypothetical protein